MQWSLFFVFRLTPPYMLFLMLYVPINKYLNDGPFWPNAGMEYKECEDTWWTNLLYINNLVKSNRQVWFRSVTRIGFLSIFFLFCVLKLTQVALLCRLVDCPASKECRAKSGPTSYRCRPDVGPLFRASWV